MHKTHTTTKTAASLLLLIPSLTSLNMKQNNILLRPRANQYWLDTKTAGHNNIAALAALKKKKISTNMFSMFIKASQSPSFHVPSSVYYYILYLDDHYVCGGERALMPWGYFQTEVMLLQHRKERRYQNMYVHSFFLLFNRI